MGAEARNPVRRQYTEQALYRQLCHFRRQLDAQRALSKVKDAAARDEAAPKLALIRAALDAGTVAALRMQERNAYHWVNLRQICQVSVP